MRFINGPMMRIWNRSHLRLRQELVVAPRARVVGILAGHLHVAAERDRADHVFGVAAREADEARPEAERKFQHPDAHAAGHDEMAQLVDENQDAEDEEKRQKCGQNTEPQTFNSNPRATFWE